MIKYRKSLEKQRMRRKLHRLNVKKAEANERRHRKKKSQRWI